MGAKDVTTVHCYAESTVCQGERGNYVNIFLKNYIRNISSLFFLFLFQLYFPVGYYFAAYSPRRSLFDDVPFHDNVVDDVPGIVLVTLNKPMQLIIDS